MKKETHPEYGEGIIACACGHKWEIRSTRKEAKVGICSKCHPFFTGTKRNADVEGRIDRFKRRYAEKK